VRVLHEARCTLCEPALRVRTLRHKVEPSRRSTTIGGWGQAEDSVVAWGRARALRRKETSHARRWRCSRNEPHYSPADMFTKYMVKRELINCTQRILSLLCTGVDLLVFVSVNPANVIGHLKQDAKQILEPEIRRGLAHNSTQQHTPPPQHQHQTRLSHRTTHSIRSHSYHRNDGVRTAGQAPKAARVQVLGR
jgi:hypothetical protein